MNPSISRRIDRIESHDSVILRNHACLSLDELISSQNPYEDWKFLLPAAQKDLLLSAECSTNSLDYFKSKLLYISTELFATSVILDTIDQTVLKSGIKRVRKNLQNLETELNDSINSEIILRPELIGLANEVSVLSCLTYTELLDRGYIALPSFPWEDDHFFGPLTHRLNDNNSISQKTEFDISLFDTNKKIIENKLQIKTRDTFGKIYETSEITVIKCTDICDAVFLDRGICRSGDTGLLSFVLNDPAIGKPYELHEVARDYLMKKLGLV